VRHSISEPRDLHAFATKVGATARNVEAARAAIGERVRAAESEVIRALRDRAAVEQAAAALVAATWEVDEVKAVKDRVEAFVADASMDDRRAKKARESVQALHEQGNRCAQEALRSKSAFAATPRPRSARRRAASMLPRGPSSRERGRLRRPSRLLLASMNRVSPTAARFSTRSGSSASCMRPEFSRPRSSPRRRASC
jgi:hypothetical protein